MHLASLGIISNDRTHQCTSCWSTIMHGCSNKTHYSQIKTFVANYYMIYFHNYLALLHVSMLLEQKIDALHCAMKFVETHVVFPMIMWCTKLMVLVHNWCLPILHKQSNCCFRNLPNPWWFIIWWCFGLLNRYMIYISCHIPFSFLQLHTFISPKTLQIWMLGAL
jgi:hypothetical protein